MRTMLHEVIGWIVAALVGWGVAQAYFRRGQTDLKAQLEALRSDIERLVTAGLVTAVRNAAGQIKNVGLPSAPTEFKLF